MSDQDELYEQLEQTMAKARNSLQVVRLGESEMKAIEVIIRKTKAAESLNSELLEEKQELERQKEEQDKVMQQVKSAMERQKLDISELETMFASAVKLLNTCIERNGSRVKLENALQVAEEPRKIQAAQTFSLSTTNLPQFISEFSLAEIKEATRNFHPSLKIRDGEYGSVYKGLLGQTQVAIKKLHDHGFLQDPSKFHQEINVLGKLRHPNLMTLMGACQELWTLIYEYLPNGSLEDRLSCWDYISLSWKTRICIAAELCSVINFLHSSKPQCIVHGNIKPDNIFLDANHVSKLCDLGTCHVISHNDNSSSSNTAVRHRTLQKGDIIDPDTDPEAFIMTGKLNPKSDVYSFGIILLRLLTGKPVFDLKNKVQRALDNRDLNSLLDTSAGDWPYVQAKQLAHLGLRCTDNNPRNRPDLGLEVWRFLELMRASCGGSSLSLRLFQPPQYFICPILLDVMQDPHVAADGFTYEAEAIRGWLDSGHDTSPMTNVQLKHTYLTPNLALHSAIQEWQQLQ